MRFWEGFPAGDLCIDRTAAPNPETVSTAPMWKTGTGLGPSRTSLAGRPRSGLGAVPVCTTAFPPEGCENDKSGRFKGLGKTVTCELGTAATTGLGEAEAGRAGLRRGKRAGCFGGCWSRDRGASAGRGAFAGCLPKTDGGRGMVVAVRGTRVGGAGRVLWDKGTLEPVGGRGGIAILLEGNVWEGLDGPPSFLGSVRLGGRDPDEPLDEEETVLCGGPMALIRFGSAISSFPRTASARFLSFCEISGALLIEPGTIGPASDDLSTLGRLAVRPTTGTSGCNRGVALGSGSSWRGVRAMKGEAMAA